MSTVIEGHEYSWVRAPIASTAIPTPWRYRWDCSCGGEGHWQTEGPQVAELGWHKHLANLRDRARTSGVPRSTTHRTTS